MKPSFYARSCGNGDCKATRAAPVLLVSNPQCRTCKTVHKFRTVMKLNLCTECSMYYFYRGNRTLCLTEKGDSEPFKSLVPDPMHVTSGHVTNWERNGYIVASLKK